MSSHEGKKTAIEASGRKKALSGNEEFFGAVLNGINERMDRVMRERKNMTSTEGNDHEKAE